MYVKYFTNEILEFKCVSYLFVQQKNPCIVRLQYFFITISDHRVRSKNKNKVAGI